MGLSLPFTSVVSYHTNPMTCGVAKFSAELAKRLGVPFVGFDFYEDDGGDHPLFSLKWSEFCGGDEIEAFGVMSTIEAFDAYSLFWHDKGDQRVLDNLANRAKHVFYADPSLGSPGLWCPSLLSDSPVPRAAINLFAMGMAHKMQIAPYKKLAALISQTSHAFQLRMSMGLHEGTDLSDAILKCEAVAQAIGPDNLSVLGILTDTAVASEYECCHAACAFFEQGARANNTTIHAAMRAGKPVITNLDAHSPPDWKHGVSVFDIHQLTAWPGIYELRRVAEVGQAISANYSWNNLISAMRKECDRSKLPTAS